MGSRPLPHGEGTMPILIFQAVIVLTIVVGAMRSRPAATIVSVAWSLFTLVMVFMPWLMILQLGVIWGTRHVATRGRTR